MLSKREAWIVSMIEVAEWARAVKDFSHQGDLRARLGEKLAAYDLAKRAYFADPSDEEE